MLMRALLNDKKIRNLIMAILIGVCILIISWPSDSTNGIGGTNGISGTNTNSQGTNTQGTNGISGTNTQGTNGIGGTNTNDQATNTSGNYSGAGTAQADDYIESKKTELKTLLEKVAGVGSVEVMITLEDSGEDIVLRDSTGEMSSETDASRSSSSTSAVEGSNGDPYVVRNVKPQIKGVVVACEGGGDPEVALKISEAVQALFGLPAHKIVVLEIK